jgi:hypothetical protein
MFVQKAWMAGTRPAMTVYQPGIASSAIASV